MVGPAVAVGDGDGPTADDVPVTRDVTADADPLRLGVGVMTDMDKPALELPVTVPLICAVETMLAVVLLDPGVLSVVACMQNS